MKAQLNVWSKIGMLCKIKGVGKFLAAVFASTTLTFASEKITVVADEWPPFSGSSLPEQGVAVDVVRAVLTRAGYQVDTAILPWARIMSEAKSGEYDIVTSLYFEPELESFVHFSAPFFQTEVKFAQKAGGEITFDGMESLRDYVIATGTDFFYDKEFDQAEFLNKIEVTTTLQGIRMVAAGHADLTLDNTHVIRHSILQANPDLLEQIELLEPALNSRSIYMGVSLTRPDHAAIVSDFDRVLHEMMSDGSFDELLEKHNLN